MKVKEVLDVKGLACPMPIVKQKSNGSITIRRSVRSTLNR